MPAVIQLFHGGLRSAERPNLLSGAIHHALYGAFIPWFARPSVLLYGHIFTGPLDKIHARLRDPTVACHSFLCRIV